MNYVEFAFLPAEIIFVRIYVGTKSLGKLNAFDSRKIRVPNFGCIYGLSPICKYTSTFW